MVIMQIRLHPRRLGQHDVHWSGLGEEAVFPSCRLLLLGVHALDEGGELILTGLRFRPLVEPEVRAIYGGIGSRVRPGSAGRLGLEELRCLHEISFVIPQVRNLPGQG